MIQQQGPSAAVRYGRETVDLAIEGAVAHGRDDLVERLRGARDLLSGSGVTVYVVGEYKQGKSSLVNALLTTSVCPVDDDIATAVPTVVRFAAEPSARAVYEPQDGDVGSPWTETITFEQIADHVAEAGNPGNRRRLRSVTVGVDRALLESGLIVVDTPGVGGLGSVRNAVTASALPSAHAVLFVSDSSQELTAAELRFLRTVAELCPTVLFVLTKTDLYPHWRRILELDLAHLAREGVTVAAFAVSSQVRSAAAESGDAELNEESGFPPLVHRIGDVIEDAERVALQSLGAHLLSAIGQIVAALSARAAALGRPEDAGDVRAELARARERADTLRSRSSRWQQVLFDGFADISSDVDFDLRVRTRAVLAEAERAIDEGDPAKNWDEFEKWLRSRLAAETLENYARFTTAADELAERVAEHFELVEKQILTVRAPVGVLEQLSIDTAALDAPKKLTGKMAIFQKTYAGYMMFTMLAHLTTLVIPSPVGIVAGLLMGRAALGEERRRAVEQRRSAARTAVRRFVEEFSLQVSKDSRDTVRRAQQEMRERYTRRAEELQRSATEALDAAREAVRGDEDAADELRRLRKDLQLFATLRARTEQMLARTAPEPAR
ncbi:dynamin family protein [Pseudonocardia yuanmonensis]|uniref:Dynamin family protein n=1 Tax=Pseudonocardia yuanmonensis TaxID=1095914 RepID=A0ABP8XIQ3_9PSEU